MLTDLGMHSKSFERNLYLSKAMDVSATAHQAGTVRFGTDPSSSALDVNCRTSCKVTRIVVKILPE